MSTVERFWSQPAIISECGRYRPWLQRQTMFPGRLAFVMLNPSTADATEDDNTVRRCAGFAQRESKGTFAVVNLFTLRATDPADLCRVTFDPVGPDADAAIYAALAGANLVVAAWGAVPSGSTPMFRDVRLERIEHVMRVADLLGQPLWCLGLTKDGSPRHPLYVPRNAALQALGLAQDRQAFRRAASAGGPGR